MENKALQEKMVFLCYTLIFSQWMIAFAKHKYATLSCIEIYSRF